MGQSRSRLVAVLAFGSVLSSQSPEGVADIAGVVVEDVAKGSQTDKAGLLAGDIISKWTIDETRGVLTSPFELAHIEQEQSARTTVVLTGWRGMAAMRWTVGPGPWGLDVAPVLEDPVRNMYQEALQLAKAREHSRAALQLKAAAASASGDKAVWLRTQAAAAFARARLWKEADDEYGLALHESVSPVFATHVLRAWATTFFQRNEWIQAEKRYEEALILIRKHWSGSLSEAAVMRELGRLHGNRGAYHQAHSWFTRALAIEEKLAPKSLLLAATLQGLGSAATDLGQFAEAEKYLRKSLELREELVPGTIDVATSLHNLGRVAQERGDLPAAESLYQRALAIFNKVAPQGLLWAMTMNNLGNLIRGRDLAKAQFYHEQALSVRQKLSPGGLGVASTLNNLAITSQLRGDLVKAEEYYRQSLAIQQKLGTSGVARSLDNLGILASARGDYLLAEHYHRQALNVQRTSSPDSSYTARSIGNLADVLRKQGKLNAAEKLYSRALAIYEKHAPGSVYTAIRLNNLGVLYETQGALTRAEECYRRALSIHEKDLPGSLGVAQSFLNLGDIARKRNQWIKANKYYRDALALREKLAPGTADHAECLYRLAVVARHKQDRTEAAELFERAISVIDNQAVLFGGSEEVRAQFRDQYSSYYRDYLKLLLANRQPERAFDVLERLRAGTLLMMLGERDLVFEDELPPELNEEQKRNRWEYDRVQSAIASLHPHKDAKKIDSLVVRMRELMAERAHIQQRIKRTSPRFAALRYPKPLSTAAARNALEPGTVLLSYSVGRDSTYLFVLQPLGVEPGLSVFTIPIGEASLRKQVNDLRTAFSQQTGASKRAAMTARILYNLLLRPAAAMTARSQRILLIPDGPLYVLPFAALLRSERQRLIEWRALHTAVSATVYAEVKKTRERREYAMELVAFGDPNYPGRDQQQLDRNGNLELRSAINRGFTLVPLPFTRTEVNSIASLFPNHSEKYLGGDATESRVKSLSRSIRYIHFAVHGLLDERFPLNSALAMSIPNQIAEGQENGLLQAWEIFEHVRWDADLVVLSVCEGGLGREVAGEGLLGLTRAIQHAGARTVLSSLWKIDDRRTARLMERFYTYLRGGATKDQALRSAQLDLLRSPADADPFYWAAFSLNGDWQ